MFTEVRNQVNSPLTCIEREVLLNTTQSPPGGLLIECSSKLLLHLPHFRGPELPAWYLSVSHGTLCYTDIKCMFPDRESNPGRGGESAES